MPAVFVLSAAQLRVCNVQLKTIVVDDNAPQTVKFAATELRNFISRCNGTDLQISGYANEEQGNIFLGSHKELLADVPSQGFRIMSQNGNLYITGHDSPDGPITGFRNPWNREEVYSDTLKFGAFGSCGTLHGTYHFLEKFAGIRFFWPGETGTVIPEKHNIELDEISEIHWPRMHYRHVWMSNFNDDVDSALWYKRCGFGGDAPVQIIHSMDVLVAKFRVYHREYLALVNGERDTGRQCARCGGGHLCLTAPGCREAVAQYIVDYFKQHPEQNTFPIVPGDGLLDCCECPSCKAEQEPEKGNTGKFSNHIWKFVNEVAKLVEKEYPDKKIGCLAYETYIDPPSAIERLNQNVAVMFCYNRSNMAIPLYEKAFHERISAWKNKSGNSLYSWNYYLNSWTPWRELPVVYPKTIQRDIRHILNDGFAGEFFEAETWICNPDKTINKIYYPATNHLNIYLTGKLYWNPDLDLKVLLDDYYTSFYGPAAHDMRAFFEYAESLWENGCKDSKITNSVFANASVNKIFNKKLLDKLMSLLESAQKRVPGNSLFGRRIAQMSKEMSEGCTLFFQQFPEDNTQN